MKHRLVHRAFSLIEVIMAIVVIGIIGSMVLPIVSGSADAYAASSDARMSTERVSFALEKCMRILRESPGSPTTIELDISQASSTSLFFDDGSGIELVGSDLMLIDTDGARSPVCRAVTRFELQLLASDGTTSTLNDLASTQRFTIEIESGGITLIGAAFPRVLMVGP